MTLNGCGSRKKTLSVGTVAAAALVLVAVGAAVLMFGLVSRSPRSGAAEADPLSFGKAIQGPSQQAHEVLRGLPLVFEANRGQTDPQVRYLARGAGYGLFLTANEAVLALHSRKRTQAGHGTSVIRMKLVQATPTPEVTGADLLPGKSNYFIGNDESKWRNNVPLFARVRYGQVYSGIDLVYYGRQGQLEYDFEVAPGADPRQISLAFSGAEAPVLDAAGDLVLGTADGDVRLQSPVVYQQIADERRSVQARFKLLADGHVGFALGEYDHSRALVIDPVLTYSTFIGGTGNEACSAITGSATPISGCPSIFVDPAGSIFIAGSTSSADFPKTTGPALTGTANVFIAKLDPTQVGTAQLRFATFFGGTGIDTPVGIGVDAGGNVVFAGSTTSTDFPASTGFQPGPAPAGKHVFVSKLDNLGAAVLYSTYLFGNGTDIASGFALDNQGAAYVTGTTTSNNLPPVTPSGAFQGSFQSNIQFFWAKINVNTTGTTTLVNFTYFGGGNPSSGAIAIGGGIALDSSKNVYISGGTNFRNTESSPAPGGTDFPILNAAQKCLDTPVNPTSGTCSVALTATDAFVAKFVPSTTALNQYTTGYVTYFGGTGDDSSAAVAVDSGGNAYITGSTASTDLVIPTSTSAFQSGNAGGGDAYVAKFGATSSTTTAVTLNYVSFLGGTAADLGTAIAADSVGGAFITGQTSSVDFHLLPTGSGTLGGPSDAFFTRIDTTATASTAGSHFSQYLGGTGTDAGTSITISPSVNSKSAEFVAGETSSADFPTLTPFQGALAGPTDGFITAFGPSVNINMTDTAPTISNSPVGVGNTVTFTYTITNKGDAISGATFIDTLPNGDTSATASTSPGNCTAATAVGSSATITCFIGALNGAGATRTVTVTTKSSVAGPLQNSAQLIVPGCTANPCSSATAPAVTVTDYSVSANPMVNMPIPAGNATTYKITLSPLGGAFPQSISLSATGLPTGATATFTTTPITNLNTGAQSTDLVIGTTVRTTTTVDLWKHNGPLYAAWLPLSGLALLGVGFHGLSRWRRLGLGLVIGAFFGLVLMQAGCGSKGSTTTTNGTPAGTYSIVVAAASGSTTHNVTVTLVVQ